MGETYNIDDKPQVGAVAYGKASAGGYVLKDDSHYIKPEVVSHIPNVHPPSVPGPLEIVEEVNLKEINLNLFYFSLF